MSIKLILLVLLGGYRRLPGNMKEFQEKGLRAHTEKLLANMTRKNCATVQVCTEEFFRSKFEERLEACMTWMATC
jgi:hypothetical protein